MVEACLQVNVNEVSHNVKSFLFDSNKIFIYSSNDMVYNLNSTNSSVNEQVHRRQTTEFCAHEIK